MARAAPAARWQQPLRRSFARLSAQARPLRSAFGEHRLWIYTSAIAFRGLVAAVPLSLLGIGLLGLLGLEDVWDDSLAPAVQRRVTQPVFEGIDYTVERIFATGKVPLIAFASALALWHLALGVRTATDALNRIHDVDESRPFLRRVATAVALALAIAACLVASGLVVTVAPRVGSGAADAALGLVRWLVAAALLALAVGLVVRYAPAERPSARWASAGSLFVIAVWIAATLLFRVWVESIANFKTPIGALTALLVVTAYLFVSAGIFLAGVQLDELLRKSSAGRGRSRRR